MIDDLFSEGKSLIHRVDTRYRLFFAVVYSFTVALSYNFKTLLVSVFVSALLVYLANLNLRKTLARIKVVVLFLLFIWIFIPFSGQGEILFHYGIFSIYTESVLLALQISLKSISILLALISLVSTMGFSNLGKTLADFRVPDKLVVLFMMTYRYIHVLEDEYKKLMRAVRVRGFIPGSSIHTYKTYAYILGMLFVKSSLRGKRVHQAMLCRGFSGKFHALTSAGSGKERYVFSSLMISVIVIFAVFEIVSL